MTEIILIEATPGRYEARLGDEVLVKNSRDPEHDAARVLLARGITGPMNTVANDGKPRMRFLEIAKMAKVTMEEGPSGPKPGVWRGTPAG